MNYVPLVISLGLPKAYKFVNSRLPTLSKENIILIYVS